MTTPTRDRVREARCVACNRTASEHNTYADANGAYTLIQLPKFAICESCVPTCSETMIDQDSDMEPEEAMLRCWFSDFKNRSIPFSELAERIMDRDRMTRDALLDAVDEDVAGLVSPEDALYAEQNRFLAPDAEMGRHIAQQIANRLGTQGEATITLRQDEVRSLLGQIRRERLKLYTDARAAIRARKETT